MVPGLRQAAEFNSAACAPFPWEPRLRLPINLIYPEDRFRSRLVSGFAEFLRRRLPEVLPWLPGRFAPHRPGCPRRQLSDCQDRGQGCANLGGDQGGCLRARALARHRGAAAEGRQFAVLEAEVGAASGNLGLMTDPAARGSLRNRMPGCLSSRLIPVVHCREQFALLEAAGRPCRLFTSKSIPA